MKCCESSTTTRYRKVVTSHDASGRLKRSKYYDMGKRVLGVGHNQNNINKAGLKQLTPEHIHVQSPSVKVRIETAQLVWLSAKRGSNCAQVNTTSQ